MAKKLENLRDKKPANLHDMIYIDKWFKTFTVYTSSQVTLYFLQKFIAPTNPCFLVTGLQVPPVTEEKGVAFFSLVHRPSDVAGELLFFFKKGNYFCDVIMIFQPY